MKVEIGPYPKKGKRKIKISISAYDTYCLDHTIVLLLIPLLKKFRKLTIGLPEWCFDESKDKYSDAEVSAAQEKFDSTLDRMINGFEIASMGGCWDFDKEKSKKVQNAYDLLAKYHGSLWW